ASLRLEEWMVSRARRSCMPSQSMAMGACVLAWLESGSLASSFLLDLSTSFSNSKSSLSKLKRSQPSRVRNRVYTSDCEPPLVACDFMPSRLLNHSTCLPPFAHFGVRSLYPLRVKL